MVLAIHNSAPASTAPGQLHQIAQQTVLELNVVGERLENLLDRLRTPGPKEVRGAGPGVAVNHHPSLSSQHEVLMDAVNRASNLLAQIEEII